MLAAESIIGLQILPESWNVPLYQHITPGVCKTRGFWVSCLKRSGGQRQLSAKFDAVELFPGLGEGVQPAAMLSGGKIPGPDSSMG